MCIILGEVKEISQTKILAAAINGNKQQLTVYSNTVDTENPVAMVLPFVGHNIEVIETRPYDMGVFGDLHKSFALGSNRSYIPVDRSGNYRYSIAHRVEDLLRLDPIFRTMGSDLVKLFTEYQKRNFGFIVCMIDKSAEYTPFAYITSMADNTIFIPTKHYHQVQHKTNEYETVANDWDHVIYVMGTRESNAFLPYSNMNNYSWSKYLPKEYSKENLFRIMRKGTYENVDTVLDASTVTKCTIT